MNRNEAHKNIGERERKCVNCWATEDLEIHHIVPLSRGGNDIASNLAYLCVSCHCKAHGIKWGGGGRNAGRPKSEKPWNYKDVLTRYITGRISSVRVHEELGLSKGSKVTDQWYYKEFLKEMKIKEIDRKATKREVIVTVTFMDGKVETYGKRCIHA